MIEDMAFAGSALPQQTTAYTLRATHTFTPNRIRVMTGIELVLESLTINGSEQMAVPVELEHFAPTRFPVTLLFEQVHRGDAVAIRLRNPTTEPVHFRFELGHG